MAKSFITKKGFRVITMTESEALQLGWGTMEGCICCNCNDIITGTIYYIPVLHDVMDKECFENWHHGATYYKEDSPYEDIKYGTFCNLCKDCDIEIEEE